MYCPLSLLSKEQQQHLAVYSGPKPSRYPWLLLSPTMLPPSYATPPPNYQQVLLTLATCVVRIHLLPSTTLILVETNLPGVSPDSASHLLDGLPDPILVK